MLQVDIYDLEDVLTQKSMVLRGEEIKSPLTAAQVFSIDGFWISIKISSFKASKACFVNVSSIKEQNIFFFCQAEDSRDAMSMALYACTFKWIIERINARIKGNSNYASIGILDIFGFENFEVSLATA